MAYEPSKIDQWTQIEEGKPWYLYVARDYTESLIYVIIIYSRKCREWALGAMDVDSKTFIEEKS